MAKEFCDNHRKGLQQQSPDRSHKSHSDCHPFQVFSVTSSIDDQLRALILRVDHLPTEERLVVLNLLSWELWGFYSGEKGRQRYC
jgi:hypothetical protein